MLDSSPHLDVQEYPPSRSEVQEYPVQEYPLSRGGVQEYPPSR